MCQTGPGIMVLNSTQANGIGRITSAVATSSYEQRSTFIGWVALIHTTGGSLPYRRYFFQNSQNITTSDILNLLHTVCTYVN